MNVPAVNPEFEALLEYLKRSRGFDFTGYKRPSLTRRIRKRMQMLSIERFTDYQDRLEVDPDEFARLFNTILINVTGFFRDPPAWEYLADAIIPRILRTKGPDEPIRVWSAGCASGEEPFSAAILLAEALGAEAFRERVKIYATDVDEEALARARHAAYSSREVQGLSAVQLDRYFDIVNGRYAFSKELRRSIIFGRHDLTRDAPISRVDLLICRNTLMYFNADTQGRILIRFHFALKDTGFMLLGKAELLLTRGSIFVPVDLKRRLFAKVPRVNAREGLLLMALEESEEPMNHLASQTRLRESAFNAAPTAQIVLDHSGALALANSQALRLFGLSAGNLGRPLQDLELSYRPVELRSLIERANAESRPVSHRDVEWPNNASGPVYLDVQVVPLRDSAGGALGVLINFEDVTRAHQLQEELQQAHEKLETTFEELQSTNEELETTNEELQSTIEELETTNEELQSTNEQLETMNEELQSTNQELLTMNDQLREHDKELDRTNLFLNSILGSMGGGVAVIDPELRVVIWNPKAEDLWGLRADEVVGQHFFNLDIGLPVERLRQPLRASLAAEATSENMVLPATNRRGKAIQCHVICQPLKDANGVIQGVIILMSDEEPALAPAG